MIRRHPHVFGNLKEDDEGQLLKNWEEIKQQEKMERKKRRQNAQK